MYNNNKIIALIPARGGSKGIKNKNITDLCGKPLIAYTIESANSSKYIDETIVSTDSKLIADISILYGGNIPFLRPSYLAQDGSKMLDVVLHAINYLREQNKLFDVLVLLQPTQPLRTNIDIDMAIETFFKLNQQPLASISEVDDHPLLIRSIDTNGRMNNLLPIGSTCRRQDMPKYYRINGCIYINKISEINISTSFNDNYIPFIMDRSHSVDIDELKDLYLASYYIYNEKK